MIWTKMLVRFESGFCLKNLLLIKFLKDEMKQMLYDFEDIFDRQADEARSWDQDREENILLVSLKSQKN
jgi:hypothetical protein